MLAPVMAHCVSLHQPLSGGNTRGRTTPVTQCFLNQAPIPLTN